MRRPSVTLSSAATAFVGLAVAAFAMAMLVALMRLADAQPPSAAGGLRMLLIAGLILGAAWLSDRLIDLHDRLASPAHRAAAIGLAGVLSIPVLLWVVSGAVLLVGGLAGALLGLSDRAWRSLAEAALSRGLVEELIAAATVVVATLAWLVYRLRQTSRLLTGVIECVLAMFLIADGASRLATSGTTGAELPLIELFLGTHVACGGIGAVERGIGHGELAPTSAIADHIRAKWNGRERVCLARLMRLVRPDADRFG